MLVVSTRYWSKVSKRGRNSSLESDRMVVPGALVAVSMAGQLVQCHLEEIAQNSVTWFVDGYSILCVCKSR